MARVANGRGRVRADLEAALGAVVDYEECSQFVVLRIQQAIRRAGLDDLLEPALRDLERMQRDVKDVRTQVLSAVDKLME